MPYFIVPLLLVLGSLLMPELAWADSGLIKPHSGNTWDLYVFGNGRIVFDILNSVKLLMVPAAGSTGFSTLLLLMATLGFLVLAIGAGFDPSKNLIRMFTYIIMAWAVSFSATHLTANLNVNDMVADKDGSRQTFTIDGVPALVAMPAALTSQVGWYFSKVIETYFTMPGDFKLAGDAGGQFNLFNKMIQDSNQYIITDPQLKQSLQAYVTDCVVPAIALNNLKGTIPGVDKDGNSVAQPISGVNALLSSVNLVETLKSATHNSIMTKYWPSSSTGTAALKLATGLSDTDLTSAAGFGVVVTCANAFPSLAADIEANANVLLKAGSDAWTRVGIMTPFETAFQSALAGAAAPGGAASTYSRPSGFIMQQAMINSMSPAFRQAAIQTNNNSMMQAAAIAQAEASQKSAWTSAFLVFNNMMGYVFTVLQAFIFAMSPLIVVAMLIPGLGRSVLTNYIQILIWLTLWMPMLSLINYIITLFGTDSLQMVLGDQGGLSLNNKSVLSEKTNDLVIAAQFLGTMTPMFTWGLVKGALAFTEFISHGVGSQFASQAGATAATGNLSMNNMSLDNTSMNKYNTAMSSTVGTQAINAFTNAGALMVSQDMGGGAVMKSGGAVDSKAMASAAWSKSISESKAASDMTQAALSHSANVETAFGEVAASGSGTARDKALTNMYQHTRAIAEGRDGGTNLSESDRKSAAESAQVMEAIAKRLGLNLGGTLSGSLGTPGKDSPASVKLGASAGLSGDTSKSNDNQLSKQVQKADEAARQILYNLKHSDQTQDNNTSSDQLTRRAGTHASRDKQASTRSSASEQRIKSEASSYAESVTQSLVAGKSVVDSFGYNNDMDMQKVAVLTKQLDSLRGEMPTEQGLNAAMSNILGTFAQRGGDAQRAYEDITKKGQQQLAALGPKAGDMNPAGGNEAKFNKAVGVVDDKLKQDEKTVNKRRAELDKRYADQHDPVRANVDGNVFTADVLQTDGKVNKSVVHQAGEIVDNMVGVLKNPGK